MKNLEVWEVGYKKILTKIERNRREILGMFVNDFRNIREMCEILERNLRNI